MAGSSPPPGFRFRLPVVSQAGEPILFCEILDAVDDVRIRNLFGFQPVDQPADFLGGHAIHVLSSCLRFVGGLPT